MVGEYDKGRQEEGVDHDVRYGGQSRDRNVAGGLHYSGRGGATWLREAG